MNSVQNQVYLLLDLEKKRVINVIQTMIKVNKQPYELVKSLTKEQMKIVQISSLQDPLKYFCPNGVQEEFINAIGNSTKDSKIPIILFTAGNGVGKTTITINSVLNVVFGSQNGWYANGLYKNFPYPRIIWYCSTGEAIKGTIYPEFDRLIPHGQGEVFKDGKPIPARIKFRNGWELIFKTYDQDPSTYESANVGLIVADEPMPEPLWRAVKSRRRMGAVTLLPMTPLYTPPYLLDEVKTAVDRGDKGYYHIKASVYDACQKRGVRGHLDADIVDSMVNSYDPEERQARAFGEFTYFSGLIYPSLHRDIHLVEPSEFPIPPYSRIFQVVDPHDSRMSACIWGAITPEGRYIVFAESPSDHKQPYWEMKRPQNIEKEVKLWCEIEKIWEKHPVDLRIMDRIFGWQNRGQRTLQDIYLKEGVKQNKRLAFIPSYKGGRKEGEIQLGHKLVRKALEPMSDGKAGLIIYNTCYHTWNGMNHYVRKHETTKSSADRGAGEGKIVEKYKDFPDVIRFFIGSQISGYTLPEKERSIKQKEWKKFKKGKKENRSTSWQTQ